jgi:hypothetical protein
MRLILLSIGLAACCGVTAESPLTIPLGLSHDATTQALRGHQFCRTDREVDGPQRVYPRCDRAGAELGDAWVTASFQGDRLVGLRRWERYGDDARAVERWNELVGERMKASAPSDAALKALKDKGQVQGGTRAVKAFLQADGTVIGVYLLTPTPPENASVLEQISYAN